MPDTDDLRVLRLIVRAQRGPVALVGAVALVGLGQVLIGRTLQVGAGRPVLASWFLLLAVGLMTNLPLHHSFGELDGAWARRRPYRLVGAVLSLAITLAGAALLSDLGSAMFAWFLALSAVGFIAAMLVGEYAHLILLIVGAASIWAEHYAGAPYITRLALAVGWLPALVGLLLAAGTHVFAPGRSSP